MRACDRANRFASIVSAIRQVQQAAHFSEREAKIAASAHERQSLQM
jgi:hypothetical protein